MKKSMSEALTPALEIALKAALLQYQKKMGKEFPYLPSLDIYNDAGFWALGKLCRWPRRPMQNSSLLIWDHPQIFLPILAASSWGNGTNS